MPAMSIDEAVATLTVRYPAAQIRIDRGGEDDYAWSVSLWGEVDSDPMVVGDCGEDDMRLLGSADSDDLGEAFELLADGMDGEPA